MSPKRTAPLSTTERKEGNKSKRCVEKVRGEKVVVGCERDGLVGQVESLE
jgi:hypothetical protein